MFFKMEKHILFNEGSDKSVGEEGWEQGDLSLNIGQPEGN